jgi:pyruvate ferredoxin oxidoreductase alpha subunit
MEDRGRPVFASPEAPAPSPAPPRWRLAWGEPDISGVWLEERFHPVVRRDHLGLGFSEGLLGVGYAAGFRKEAPWLQGLPPRIAAFFQEKWVRSRFYLVTRELLRDELGQLLPLFTVAKTDEGQGVVVELNPDLAGREELYFSLALYSLVQANTPFSRHRFDAHGDFMRLGAFSLVDRHNAELVRKHLAGRIYLEAEGCTHCLKCVTSCNEMRVGFTPEGPRVLGPAEDYCTTCRLCLSHCPRLVEVRKADLPPEERAMPQKHFTGGEATYLTGAAAREFARYFTELDAAGGSLNQWRFTPVYQGATLPEPGGTPPSDLRQYLLEDERPDGPFKPLLVSIFTPAGSPDPSLIILRLRARVAVFLHTDTGRIETELVRGLQTLGVLYQGVVDREKFGCGGPQPLAADLHRLGRLDRNADLASLAAAGKVDVVLSPRLEALPASVQAYFLKTIGNLAPLLAPQVYQAFTFSHQPLLNELREICLQVFPCFPELLAAEAEQARIYLSDIPRYSQEIHAAYRPWGIASGHSACPTCAELATLAVPLYMAMLLSLARGQVPEVTFTCETGCMSETLNKVREVAQKVKGGRTVFGGGFALGEAAAMTEDWAMSRGLLPHGRRYVVSQSGDGGAVIGLPAWLNALRQRAFLVKDREARVLHFLNVTDTQVYSNTGGESSASSMLGMSTLTTPLGRFLIGNQRLQWQLINLAAEFPGVLVGQGHSADKVAMQEFWAEADRLGRSAIRWDVTPCPETGKFFGEDPDHLARVMAHAGFLPQIVFVGRLRKRVAPLNPGDRRKNWREWRSEPQPIYYWLERDPRYRPLLRQDPVTGRWEPPNPAVRAIISQLERFRDNLNRQIDLETRLVREAEEYTAAFFEHLQEEWRESRQVPEEFPYYFLFNEEGELKPEFGPSLKRDFLEAVLGQGYVADYTAARDQKWREDVQVLEGAGEVTASLAGAELLPPPRLFPGPASPEAEPDAAAARQAAFCRLLDRLLDERALAKAAQISQYVLKKELARDFLRQGGTFNRESAPAALPARQEFRAALAALGDFALGVASLAGERGIAINRVFSHFFTARGAWAGMAWQFGSSKRGTPVFSGTFVSPRPIQRKDALLSFPFYVLTVTNYGDLQANPDVFYDNLHPRGFLIINTPKAPEEIHQELLAHYDEPTRQAAARAREAPEGQAREEVSRFLFETPFSALPTLQQRQVAKILALARAKVITTDLDGIMAQVAGPLAVSNLVAVAPMMRALEALGLPLAFEADLPVLTGGFPGAVLKKKKLLDQYLTAMRRVYRESQGFEAAESSLTPRPEGVAADPGDCYLETGGTLAGLVMSQLATAEHPLFYIGFPITPAGNPFYALAQAFANGHPYLLVDENNPSEKVAAEKLLGVARTGGALPVTFTASQGWRLFAEIMPQLVGARLECLFVLCKRALAAPALNIEESHTDFMTFRDDGAIMLSPKSTQEFVPCLYLARLLTHWARLPVVASLGGITDTHKIGLIKVPSDRRVQGWLRKWLGSFDFLEDKLLNRQGEVIVHGPSATNEFYQETQSEVEKAHALARRVFPYAVRAVEELTGYRFEPLELAATSPGEPLTTALVLSGSFYPNAEEAVRELAEEGWRGLGAVSVRLFNPFPEEELANLLAPAQVVAVLDRSNSFGAPPPLASRVLGALARQRREAPPVWRLLVGGLGGREITVAQLKEILKFSHLFLVPRSGVEPLRRQILAQDPLLAGLLAELAALESRSWERHTRVPAHLFARLNYHENYAIPSPLMAEGKGWSERAGDLSNPGTFPLPPPPSHPGRGSFEGAAVSGEPAFTAKFQDRLTRDLIQGDYARVLANYGPVEFVEPKEVWEESRSLKSLVIRLEMLLARELLARGRPDWRAAVTLLEYGVSRSDYQEALTALEKLIQEAPAGTAWDLYRLGEGYRSKYHPLGLTLAEPLGPLAGAPARPQAQPAPEPADFPEGPPPAPVFDPALAARLRQVLRELVAESGRRETLRNPEDLERAAWERLAPELNLDLSGHPREAWLEAYQELYSGVCDRALAEEVLCQHYAPELREIFAGDGRVALELVVQATLAHRAGADGPPPDQDGLTREAALEVERYLWEEVYPRYRRDPGFYHDFYRAWVEPEIRQAIARKLAKVL